MADVKKLVEEYSKLDLKEDADKDKQNKEDFEAKIINLINEKYVPLYQELFQVVKTMKELYPDTNMYSFTPTLDRKIDEIIETAASLKDIIDGKDLGKGIVKKIRKVLGYNG